jgi:hypothetical protein
MHVTASPRVERWQTAAPPITLAPSKRHLRPAKLAIATAVGVLVVSTIGMLRGVEPFATWYYQFSWYSVLLGADGVLAHSGKAGRGIKGEFLLLSHRSHLISMLAWSAVVWFFYELLNFRLLNWHYIYLPANLPVRWVSTAIAFATVLPAVFVAETLLASVRFGENIRWRPLPVTPTFVGRMRIAGALMMLLVLVWPRYFFALVWGASMLMIEPTVYNQARHRSLLHDLEQGRPGRLLRLLAGGAAIGLLWELLNMGARAKWIYTVPFFENLKLFEMPVPGFLGFPPFAVECFIIWQALVSSGLATPRFGPRVERPRNHRLIAGVAGTLFCLLVLAGMEGGRTFTSFRPQLSELPGVPAPILERAGYDVFRLAHSTPVVVAADVGSDRQRAAQWVTAAQLAALRGIGSERIQLLHNVGIYSVTQLAEVNPGELIQRIEAETGEDWLDARIRVWVRGARRSLER